MATSSPARLYCTLAGAVLVILGVIGFFYSAGFASGSQEVARDTDELFGLFAVNGWHNLARIALGVVALIAAGSAARVYALAAGLLYLILAVWGWIDSDGIVLGLIPLNDEDNILNLLLGLTGVAAGAATAKPGVDRKAKGAAPSGSRARTRARARPAAEPPD